MKEAIFSQVRRTKNNFGCQIKTSEIKYWVTLFDKKSRKYVSTILYNISFCKFATNKKWDFCHFNSCKILIFPPPGQRLVLAGERGIKR